MSEKVHCECGSSIKHSSRDSHMKSKRHNKFFGTGLFSNLVNHGRKAVEKHVVPHVANIIKSYIPPSKVSKIPVYKPKLTSIPEKKIEKVEKIEKKIEKKEKEIVKLKAEEKKIIKPAAANKNVPVYKLTEADKRMLYPYKPVKPISHSTNKERSDENQQIIRDRLAVNKKLAEINARIAELKAKEEDLKLDISIAEKKNKINKLKQQIGNE